MKRCPLIGRIVEHPSGCDGCDGCREAEERRQRREDEQADAGMDARRERGIFAERDRLREALERIQTMTVLEWQGTARGCYIIAGKALEPR